jgi:hypothetical protein
MKRQICYRKIYKEVQYLRKIIIVKNREMLVILCKEKSLKLKEWRKINIFFKLYIVLYIFSNLKRIVESFFNIIIII